MRRSPPVSLFSAGHSQPLKQLAAALYSLIGNRSLKEEYVLLQRYLMAVSHILIDSHLLPLLFLLDLSYHTDTGCRLCTQVAFALGKKTRSKFLSLPIKLSLC